MNHAPDPWKGKVTIISHSLHQTPAQGASTWKPCKRSQLMQLTPEIKRVISFLNNAAAKAVACRTNPFLPYQ